MNPKMMSERNSAPRWLSVAASAASARGPAVGGVVSGKPVGALDSAVGALDSAVGVLDDAVGIVGRAWGVVVSGCFKDNGSA